MRMTRTGERAAFSPSDSGGCPMTPFLVPITNGAYSKTTEGQPRLIPERAGGEVLSGLESAWGLGT